VEYGDAEFGGVRGLVHFFCRRGLGRTLACRTNLLLVRVLQWRMGKGANNSAASYSSKGMYPLL